MLESFDSIIDGWLGTSEEKTNRKAPKELNAPNRGKTGLGHKPVKQDALEERIQRNFKIQQRKRKKFNEDDNASDLLHGIVGEEIESKIPQPREEKHAKTVPPLSKTAVFHPKQRKHETSTSTATSLSNFSTLPSDLSDLKEATNADHLILKADFPRKRSKTRSKQKNIRRDNRPDSSKPVHLQFGSNTYEGRYLTEVTNPLISS
jgi:hypothetical protein